MEGNTHTEDLICHFGSDSENTLILAYFFLQDVSTSTIKLGAQRFASVAYVFY